MLTPEEIKAWKEKNPYSFPKEFMISKLFEAYDRHVNILQNLNLGITLEQLEKELKVDPAILNNVWVCRLIATNRHLIKDIVGLQAQLSRYQNALVDFHTRSWWKRFRDLF